MKWIFEQQKHNPDYFKDYPYVVKERSSNEKNRYEALLRFDGPDTETTQLFNNNLDSWEREPARFWTHAAPETIGQDALTSMAMYYRRVKQTGP